ncbi:MAG: ferredoxin [archaeon]
MAKVKYKITVDKNKCIGCGSCVAMCEENFELVNGKAVAKKAVSDLPCNKEAAESCPVNVIKLAKA